MIQLVDGVAARSPARQVLRGVRVAHGAACSGCTRVRALARGLCGGRGTRLAAARATRPSPRSPQIRPPETAWSPRRCGRPAARRAPPSAPEAPAQRCVSASPAEPAAPLRAHRRRLPWPAFCRRLDLVAVDGSALRVVLDARVCLLRHAILLVTHTRGQRTRAQAGVRAQRTATKLLSASLPPACIIFSCCADHESIVTDLRGVARRVSASSRRANARVLQGRARPVGQPPGAASRCAARHPPRATPQRTAQS
jgi:hypothetical protein